MSGLVRRTDQDGVAVLRLEDPDRRNVLSAAMVDDLVAAIDGCERDSEVGAIVLTGQGSAFCAGAVLDDLLAAAAGDTMRLRHIYSAFLRLALCPLPTVAAVNGPAVGAGFNLALACDVLIAGEKAVFECRFPRLGLHPGGGHTWLLQRAVGPQVAAAALLFDEALDGPRAAASGLALRCVPTSELLDAALVLATRAARLPAGLLRTVKRTLRETVRLDLEDAVEIEFERQVASLRQPEFQRRTDELRARLRQRV
jgi:enoyl-CoA hydratase